jgi:hypothetical protein
MRSSGNGNRRQQMGIGPQPAGQVVVIWLLCWSVSSAGSVLETTELINLD